MSKRNEILYCPKIENCSILEMVSSKFRKQYFLKVYCKGEFKKCERYILSTCGKSVPVNLMPDGSLESF